MDELRTAAGQHRHVHGLADLASTVRALRVMVEKCSTAGEKQQRSAGHHRRNSVESTSSEHHSPLIPMGLHSTLALLDGSLRDSLL
jgi:hypothetical protein